MSIIFDSLFYVDHAFALEYKLIAFRLVRSNLMPEEFCLSELFNTEYAESFNKLDSIIVPLSKCDNIRYTGTYGVVYKVGLLARKQHVQAILAAPQHTRLK